MSSANEKSDPFVLTLQIGIVLFWVIAHFFMFYGQEAGRRHTIRVWQVATARVVEVHNARHLRRYSLDEMTPELLLAMTDPCMVWDYRERLKRLTCKS